MRNKIILKVGKIELTRECASHLEALQDAYYLAHKIASNCERVPGTDTWKIKSAGEWIDSWQIDVV